MIIIPKPSNIDVQVTLGGSKSESNRAVMISAYGGFREDIQNISQSDDTQLLKRLLVQIDAPASVRNTIVDCNDAGTVCRFLLTYLVEKKGEWTLTGSKVLCRRPIGSLVGALKNLGAQIEYLGVEGFLPLKITGTEMQGGVVDVSTNQSSQFASSLLLAAPNWPRGLRLILSGNLSSLPYIDMTIQMMKQFGANVRREGREVVVKPQKYQPTQVAITSDWSSASYWFEVAAFCEPTRIFISKLSLSSCQGDAAIAEICDQFGVDVMQTKYGILLQKTRSGSRVVQFDFLQTPDLFPSVLAICAGLQVSGKFKGLKNLAIKESDRVASMVQELSKLDVQFERLSEDEMNVFPSEVLPHYTIGQPLLLDTHGDHRIAMALSLLALKIGAISIEDPLVVSKSYPDYWSDMSKKGFLEVT